MTNIETDVRPAHPTAPSPSVPSPAARRDGVGALWAIAGVVFAAIAVAAWVQWIASGDQFVQAPILGPDEYSDTRLVGLRVIEALSVLVLVGIVWATVVTPLRRDGRLGFDGRTAIGCLFAASLDGMLNMFEYLFAWNAHSLNLGGWTAFLPLTDDGASTRFAEALAWGVPMYLYFIMGVGMMGHWIVMRLRARYPGISNARAYLVVFAFACVFDFVVENAIIRSTQAYAFAKTNGALTLWSGSLYQYPIYEIFLVAVMGVLFTSLRLSVTDSPDGISYAERGFERFRPALQPWVRLFAITGFSCMVLFLVYHVGFNWLGTNGDSIAPLPSYLRPGGA
jgi:hypothetical protein